MKFRILLLTVTVVIAFVFNCENNSSIDPQVQNIENLSKVYIQASDSDFSIFKSNVLKNFPLMADYLVAFDPIYDLQPDSSLYNTYSWSENGIFYLKSERVINPNQYVLLITEYDRPTGLDYHLHGMGSFVINGLQVLQLDEKFYDKKMIASIQFSRLQNKYMTMEIEYTDSVFTSESILNCKISHNLEGFPRTIIGELNSPNNMDLSLVLPTNKIPSTYFSGVSNDLILTCYTISNQLFNWQQIPPMQKTMPGYPSALSKPMVINEEFGDDDTWLSTIGSIVLGASYLFAPVTGGMSLVAGGLFAVWDAVCATCDS